MQTHPVAGVVHTHKHTPSSALPHQCVQAANVVFPYSWHPLQSHRRSQAPAAVFPIVPECIALQPLFDVCGNLGSVTSKFVRNAVHYFDCAVDVMWRCGICAMPSFMHGAHGFPPCVARQQCNLQPRHNAKNLRGPAGCEWQAIFQHSRENSAEVSWICTGRDQKWFSKPQLPLCRKCSRLCESHTFSTAVFHKHHAHGFTHLTTTLPLALNNLWPNAFTYNWQAPCLLEHPTHQFYYLPPFIVWHIRRRQYVVPKLAKSSCRPSQPARISCVRHDELAKRFECMPVNI